MPDANKLSPQLDKPQWPSLTWRGAEWGSEHWIIQRVCQKHSLSGNKASWNRNKVFERLSTSFKHDPCQFQRGGWEMVDRGNVSANKCFSWVGDGSCGYFSILFEITESGGYTSGPGEVGVWYEPFWLDAVPPKTYHTPEDVGVLSVKPRTREHAKNMQIWDWLHEEKKTLFHNNKGSRLILCFSVNKTSLFNHRRRWNILGWMIFHEDDTTTCAKTRTNLTLGF